MTKNKEESKNKSEGANKKHNDINKKYKQQQHQKLDQIAWR